MDFIHRFDYRQLARDVSEVIEETAQRSSAPCALRSHALPPAAR